MQSKGIKRVLSLLGDDEVTDYYPNIDLDQTMRSSFGDNQYTRISVFASNAYDVMSRAISDAKESGDPIVMHCSGGEGRAALAMALWLVNVYGLPPEDAVLEIDAETARNTEVTRRTDLAKVKYLINSGTMSGFSK